MHDYYHKHGFEIVVSTKETSLEITRSVKKGVLRKISAQLYTPNLLDDPKIIVQRNLWHIIAAFMPGAILCDRTAFLLKPTDESYVYVISKRTRDLKLPGMVIKTRLGAQAMRDDQPFLKGLYLPSTARCYLENMVTSRSRNGHVSRTLTPKEIEERLELSLQRGGEEALNQLRDHAKTIASSLGLENECQKLCQLIGTLLSTKKEKTSSPFTHARIKGIPYDPIRLNRFEILYRALKNKAPTSRLCEARIDYLPFFESYFSNFIEGTEFGVEEAKSIVLEGVIAKNRPEDAHDILSTFHLVSDRTFMKTRSLTIKDFIQTLKGCHAHLMAMRQGQDPGQFKNTVNRAGSTVFMSPERVEGTLTKGFELYQSLDVPLHRAIYIMFLICEVHPFLDGNGRTARIMMNKELESSKEWRLIIPTVFRENYLQSLKALSHHNHPEPLIQVLDFAQRFTASLSWEDFDHTHHLLMMSHAFLKSHKADSYGKKLKIITGFA